MDIREGEGIRKVFCEKIYFGFFKMEVEIVPNNETNEGVGDGGTKMDI